MHMRDGKMADALAKAIADAKVKRDRLRSQLHHRRPDRCAAAIDRAKEEAKAKRAELVPLEDVMTNIRKVKDDQEIDLIRKSVAIAEEAFEAIRDEIKVGKPKITSPAC